MDEHIGVICAPAHLVDHSISSIRWRASHYTGDKNYHEFAVGDQVMIARLSPNIPTTQKIIGHFGEIIEVDDMCSTSVEFQCSACGGIHTMHEDELDYMGSTHMNALRDKTDSLRALDREPIDERTMVTEHIENSIAVAMHAAGFLMPAVEDRKVPAADPEFRRPHWSKYVYGKIWRLAPFSEYHAKLIDIARSVDGVLVEWASKSAKHGWVSIAADDLEVLTLEMPIRASLQSRASTEDNSYDQAKWAAMSWLKDKNEIDIAAIYHAIRKQGWNLSNWSAPTHMSEDHSFTVLNGRARSMAAAHAAFKKWAKKEWCWQGKYHVHVTATKDDLHSGVYAIVKFDGTELTVEDEEDVPF
jgi:hypothetical protein